jgi:hypothetical protein
MRLTCKTLCFFRRCLSKILENSFTLSSPIEKVICSIEKVSCSIKKVISLNEKVTSLIEKVTSLIEKETQDFAGDPEMPQKNDYFLRLLSWEMQQKSRRF